MRVYTILLLLASTSAIASNGSFILDPSLGPQVLKQCSRPTPAHIQRFWRPEEQDISVLETRLQAFLTTSNPLSDHLPLTKYHGQYVGFIRSGRRYIYGNLYPVVGGIADRDESKVPVVICDGGRELWGFVYSVQTGEFSEFESNGVA